MGLVRPFRAWEFAAEFPGRCPGLELKRPVGAENTNRLNEGYQYDALNRLTNLVWKNGTTALANFAIPAPTGRFNTAHGSAMGKTAYTHRSPVGANQTWRQDLGLVRPFRACGFDAEFPGRCPGLELKRPVGAETLSYNANDLLTTDTYDRNGNTIASGGTTYGYDYENRLGTG
jgi:hypothetical protein